MHERMTFIRQQAFTILIDFKNNRQFISVIKLKRSKYPEPVCAFLKYFYLLTYFFLKLSLNLRNIHIYVKDNWAPLGMIILQSLTIVSIALFKSEYLSDTCANASSSYPKSSYLWVAV